MTLASNNTLRTVVVFTFNLVNMVCVFLVLSVPKKFSENHSSEVWHVNHDTWSGPCQALCNVLWCRCWKRSYVKNVPSEIGCFSSRWSPRVLVEHRASTLMIYPSVMWQMKPCKWQQSQPPTVIRSCSLTFQSFWKWGSEIPQIDDKTTVFSGKLNNNFNN